MNADARQRVNRAIAGRGYAPEFLVRSLRSRRTRMQDPLLPDVGLVLGAHDERFGHVAGVLF